MNDQTLACPCGGRLVPAGRWKLTNPVFGGAVCDRCGADVTVYKGHDGAVFLTKDEARQSKRAARVKS